MTAGDAQGEGVGQVGEEKRKAYRREMGCHILVLYDWPTEREDDLHFSLPPSSLVQKALLSSPPSRPPPPHASPPPQAPEIWTRKELVFPGSAGVLPLRFGYHGDRLHGNPQLAFSRMGLDPSPPAGALPLPGFGIWGDVWVVILGVCLPLHAYLGRSRES